MTTEKAGGHTTKLLVRLKTILIRGINPTFFKGEFMRTFRKSLILSVFLSVSVFAGGRCRNVEVKDDPFTGENTKVSMDFYSYNLENYFKFDAIGDEYFVSYKLIEYGDVDQIFPKDETIDIAFENGEILQLTNLEDIAPVTAVRGQIKTHWIVKSPLSREEIELFANSYIVAIRVRGMSVSGTNSDPYSKRYQKTVSELANCIICTDCSY